MTSPTFCRQVALFEPEIPPNTGNILRLCANSKSLLHLIRPLGFRLTDKAFQRAVMDYQTSLQVHDNFAAFQRYLEANKLETQLFAFTTKGRNFYHHVIYPTPSILLFGPESRGLPKEILSAIGERRCLRIPMQTGSRSLNLANAVSIALYEVWRQQDFVDGLDLA
jgi:tRNA (cytidine/uridine-2'-O-)-methyltransferase